MAVIAPRRQTPTPARGFGHLVAVLANALLLGVVNVWPGWQIVPFLTYDTRQVVAVLNASLVAGIVVNIIYIAADPRWLKAIGDLILGGFSLVVLLRIWQVFPFALPSTGLEIAVQALLAVAVLVVAVGMIASVAVLAGAGRSTPR